MVDNPAGKQVIVVEVELEETDHLTAGHFLSTLSDIFYLLLVAVGGLMGSIGRLWTDYFPRVVIGEEAEMLPRSTLGFIIAALLAFAQIKSQGETGFPFQTHPQTTMVSVTSLLIYGLASAAEHLISAADSKKNMDYINAKGRRNIGIKTCHEADPNYPSIILVFLRLMRSIAVLGQDFTQLVYEN